MIKRRVSTILLILICFVLQTTLLQHIKLASVAPNLLMIITVSIGYMRGRTEGLLVGFFCGLMFDMMYGSVIGLYAFIYMTVGFLTGYCQKIYFTDNVILPIGLVFCSETVYGLYYYIVEFLLRGRTNIGFFLVKVIIPEVIYTTVLAVFLLRFLRFLEKWLSPHKKEV